MSRLSKLSYDRGTLVLHPPPKGAKGWLELAEWDDRVDRFRVPALQYMDLLERLRLDKTTVQDDAKGWQSFELERGRPLTPFEHQTEALAAWSEAGGRGTVVLPTGSGKTILAHMALEQHKLSCLVVVPTIDLMQQWYTGLKLSFPEADVGLLGGGSRDSSAILVATYDSAALYAEALGNRYALVVFDECHHLPSDFYRVIAEFSIAPFRLGLSATPERGDGRHADLEHLIGPVVYRKTQAELAGGTLSSYREEHVLVTLSSNERERYNSLRAARDAFLQSKNLRLGGVDGWQKFVQLSGRSREGRAAMLAHREARELAFGADGKIRVLEEILARHAGARTLIFTDDNRMVYRISRDFLLPALTHQTAVKERHEMLERFRAGIYPTLVTSRVLNEGVDVPEASIAILLSGTGTEREYIQRLGRILRKGEGKEAILYEVVAEGTAEESVSKRRKGEWGKEQAAEIKPARAPSTWATRAMIPTEIKWEDL